MTERILLFVQLSYQVCIWGVRVKRMSRIWWIDPIKPTYPHILPPPAILQKLKVDPKSFYYSFSLFTWSEKTLRNISEIYFIKTIPFQHLKFLWVCFSTFSQASSLSNIWDCSGCNYNVMMLLCIMYSHCNIIIYITLSPHSH